MKPKKSISDSITSTVLDTLTTFLQDFTKALAVGDMRKAAVAAARVSQLGLSVFEFFGSGGEALCDCLEDKVACHEAAIVVRNMMEKHLDAWYQDSKSVAEKANLKIN